MIQALESNIQTFIEQADLISEAEYLAVLLTDFFTAPVLIASTEKVE